jgi:uncharacterized protein (DUF433 family)
MAAASRLPRVLEGLRDKAREEGTWGMITAPINHICVDERGVAYIAGTRIKVRHVVVERQAHRASVERIQEAFPHLSLGQIHAALAYYFDHREQVDAEIAEAEKYAEQARAQNPNELTRQQLEARLKKQIDSSPR